MFDELQDVGCSVRTMQIDISLFLTHESLVAVGTEETPCADKVLDNTDVGIGLDVIVASIEETADIESWNQLIRLIASLGLRTLEVQVEMIARRCLQITLLEWLAMPQTIAFVDCHVIHVDRNPHVARCIGDLVIDALVDDEVVGLGIAILDVIDAWFGDSREVEMHIVVFIISAPLLYRA